MGREERKVERRKRGDGKREGGGVRLKRSGEEAREGEGRGAGRERTGEERGRVERRGVERSGKETEGSGGASGARRHARRRGRSRAFWKGPRSLYSGNLKGLPQ